MGAQVYMYPSKLAIQLSVQYLQLNLIIIILPVGVQLSHLVCSLLMGSFSVCEKLDVVHQVYDPRGGLKYTCTLQISYTAICTVLTAEFNNYHTSSGCTTKPFGLQSVDGLL